MRRLQAQDFKRYDEVPTQELPDSLIEKLTDRMNEFLDSLPWYIRTFAKPLVKRLRLLLAQILKDVADEVAK